MDAQRVSGAQEAFWSSLEAYVGWELDSVMCGRGTRAGVASSAPHAVQAAQGSLLAEAAPPRQAEQFQPKTLQF